MKILKYLEDLIITGRLSAGDKLPSENDLAKMFSTTRVTVRKALDELEKNGVISKVQGVGTFVTEINLIARKRVGVLVNNRQIMYGIVKFLSFVGVRIIASDFSSFGSEEAILKEIVSKNIYGLIMEPTQDSIKNLVLNDLIEKGFPVVFVDRKVPIHSNVPAVLSDNYLGGKLLGEHMYQKHHVKKSIFVTSESMTVSSVSERYKGISNGLKKKPEIVYIEKIDGDFSIIPNIVMEKNVDCIFFCNDVLAVRGLYYLIKAGIKIPDEVKIAGFDNEFVSRMTEPKLTTVKQSLSEIGEVAASVMISKLKGESIDSDIKIKTELVIRDSCGCIGDKK